jgi:hypothetical protein
MLCAVGLATFLMLWSQPASAQADPPPQGTSRGENFSAKPAPQLFASDCTGAGCHKGPQGLGKNHGQFGLATFLREHYTNSRQSAAALAEYLLRTQGPERAARPTPGAQSSRAAARPEELVPASPSPAAGQSQQGRRTTEPNDGKPGARHQRGRQTTAATPAAAAAPPEAPPPPPAPPATPPPAPKQYDIFD